jgi:protein-disulfide isomerase
VSKSNFVGSGEDYRIGNDSAKVVLQMFSDFECPHCKSTSENILSAISKIDSSQVLFVYRNFPLSNKCNKHVGGEGRKYSCDLASASRCAGQQGKFWQFKEWAFSGIEMSASDKEKNFAPQGMMQKAQDLGVDVPSFKQCFESKVEYAKIQEDASLGQKLGLQGTPLLILNGKKFEGGRSAADFVAAFNLALAQ